MRFSFNPESSENGVSLEGFRLRIWSTGGFEVEREVIQSVPELTMSVPPGRYHWQVRWWSASGELSEKAMSGFVVAPEASIWSTVPWMGNESMNEFSARVDLKYEDGPVEILVATLGFGYVTINGQPISQDVLSYSGWTNTNKRVLYRSYNITGLLNASGQCSIFVGLGCGYRCDPQGRFPAYRDGEKRSQDSISKVFRLQILQNAGLIFHSGSAGWLGRQGPVQQDSVYDGEVFVSAALGAAWRSAVPLPLGTGPQGKMVPASFPGVQITGVDMPLSITNPSAGVHVVDFGSNVAGVTSISIPKPANVSLRHGEFLQHAQIPRLLKPDPSRVYFGNLRSAKQEDTLTLDRPVTDWWPRFTYHGFRYVEVYGYPGNLLKMSIKRLRLNTAVEDKASANFSDEVLQAIHLGSKGSQRSNLMQVPTDCPQRDERLGWMGDASLSAESIMLHFDYGSMAAAFVDSMVDEMDSGALPDVVPYQRFGGRPADLSWNSAFLETLRGIWKTDKNLAPARNHWEAIKANVAELMRQLSKAGSLLKLPEPYGDWCPPPSKPGDSSTQEHPSKGFAAAFSLVRILKHASELATALAQPEGGSWSATVGSLVRNFHDAYYNSKTGNYDNGAMISYVLPLALGATPDVLKPAVMQKLVQHINRVNKTWTGGIINNRFIFDVLHENGAADLALAMLQKRSYPSYGYMYFNDLEPASECMWELPDAPFEGNGMNSRNHHMFSSVGHYLLTRVAGLSHGPGDREITAVVGSLQHASSILSTAHGRAQFAWTQLPSKISVQVAVPVGMTAHVHLPADGDVIDAQLGRAVFSMKRTTLHHKHYQRLSLHSGHHNLLVQRKRSNEVVV